MFKYCSVSDPVSLSAKCNDTDLALSLSLSELSGTKLGHSLAKWSYSLHLKHLILSLFVLVLDPDLELDGDQLHLSLSLSLDLDCLHVLLFSQFLSILLLLYLPWKVYLFLKNFLSENYLYHVHILYYLHCNFY